MSYYDTPEDLPSCPKCNGTGYHELPTELCNECPYINRDCKECIKSNDHLIDRGVYCDLCLGTGTVSEYELEDWKSELHNY